MKQISINIVLPKGHEMEDEKDEKESPVVKKLKKRKDTMSYDELKQKSGATEGLS